MSAIDRREEREGKWFECTIVMVLGDVCINAMWENFGVHLKKKNYMFTDVNALIIYI